MPTSPAKTHSATSCRRAASDSPASLARRDDVVGDLAAVDRDVVCEGVDSSVDRVVGLGAGPHRVDLVRFDPQGAEHGGVERDAIGVVDSDADRHAGDLTVHWIERLVGHRATQRVEGRQEGRAGSGDGGQVGHEAEVGGDAIEHRSGGRRCVVGSEDVEVHGHDHPTLAARRRFPTREATSGRTGRNVAAMSTSVMMSQRTASAILSATGGGCGR